MTLAPQDLSARFERKAITLPPASRSNATSAPSYFLAQNFNFGCHLRPSRRTDAYNRSAFESGKAAESATRCEHNPYDVSSSGNVRPRRRDEPPFASSPSGHGHEPTSQGLRIISSPTPPMSSQHRERS